MIVYFMRHGLTDYTARGLINCDSNVQVLLNKTGARGLHEVRRKLGSTQFDLIFTSEFICTQQSGDIIGDGRFPFSVDKRLNEFNSGMDGKSVTEYRKLRDESGVRKYDFKLEGFESMSDVTKRITLFLEEIKKKDYRDVLVVTHESVILAAMVALGKIKEDDLFSYNIDNGQYMVFSI